MRERRWLLLALYGLLLATAVTGALKATRPKFKIATTSTTSTTTEEPDVADNEDGEATTISSDVNATTGHTLTGIPQIDYIWDPNLPRELNGYNLSEYPFYNSIPEEIDFKCDGLHDGFYASVPHKCQVYHHCLFGTRYDFLCANFTAFDQKTFICHFASEVDCANSKKYWHRNDALYKAAETTTTSTTSTSTTTTSPPTTTIQSSGPGPRPGSRRRRPFRRRPAYDYYDDEYYDDDPAYERSRPRGYDRRDDYDYEERKYTRRDRERDRDFRDRDYRERPFRDPERPLRDPERPLRDPERPLKDDREVPLSPRERFPSRNNRREPVRPAVPLSRDSIIEDEPRSRNRDQELPSRTRDPEDLPLDDRRTDSRNREVDDRRYSDKGLRDDYEDEPLPGSPSSSSGTADVLVKPAAPSSSVYARPRAPPKIRRPVPISEQDKFAYKATAAPPIGGEARRRPAEVAAEDDYYEDEIEEVRPRRPSIRRRPGSLSTGFRDRDRDFYETPRDRERDRPFRSRYRDEEDEVRPRKYQERNRERYYERGPERGRDRSLDRGKDRANERTPEITRERTIGRIQEAERPITSRTNDRERETDRPRSSSRSKEPVETIETTRKPNIYERTSVTPQTSPRTSTEIPREESTSQHSSERPERPERPFRTGHRPELQSSGGRNAQIAKTESQTTPPIRHNPVESVQEHREDREGSVTQVETHEENPGSEEIPTNGAEKLRGDVEEYSSIEEYYDDPEYQPAPPPPPPRTAVRIVKRPFLPSRGGNPNPRGLSPVGSKAVDSTRKEESSLNRPGGTQSSQSHKESYRPSEHEEDKGKSNGEEDKRVYDAYKFIQTDVNHKSRNEEYEGVLSRPNVKRPHENPGQRDEEELRTIGRRPVEDSRETIDNSRTWNGDSNNSGNSGSTRNVSGGRGRVKDEEDTIAEREKPALKWNSEEYRLGQRGDVRHDTETNQQPISSGQNRPKSRIPVTENSGYYSDVYSNENNEQLNVTPATNTGTNKQIINEVVTHHRLQDIPESEYDVTLNEALTPSFSNQDGNLPSGFVLPVHRQLARDPVLQSTENSYKVSRPYNQQPIQQTQQQQLQQTQTQQQQQQQKPFVPSPQFLPLAGIGSGNGNERSRSVQYFRTPEAVHVTGPQYRHQRGPWQDYTGY